MTQFFHEGTADPRGLSTPKAFWSNRSPESQCLFNARDDDSIKAVSSLPQCFQSLFSFRYFNPVQSETFNEAFLSDQNLVISAPTGSGKTVIFELAILRLLSRSITPSGSFCHAPGRLKVVYVAPMKALVQEKHREWKEKFGQHLHMNCQELTGDSEFSGTKEMQDVDIILTTPEKFDSLTRKRKDFSGLSFFGDIALLLIDEVHLLSDPRGAALEAIVSRMKMLARYPEMRGCPIASIRFVAVSATIPNIEDIAEWLNVSGKGLKRFGEEMRPVKLTTHVQGYSQAKNDFLFERKLQNYLYDTILQHNEGKPTLVFCSTRKGAQEAAANLSEQVSRPGTRNPFIKSQQQYDRLYAAALSTSDKHMQACIRQGVAFHNGGLDFKDRALVEGLFLRADVHVLCTTNTLAHGVNLPAHLVIIKSTQYYNKEKGGYVEYERSMLLQMAGRAGRPQFDTTGTVVIMTRKETAHLYRNLLAGSEPVESELLGTIAEHLNAEIVLLTVSDTSLAIDWLKSSFLYLRIKKNPQHYKIRRDLTEEQLENTLKEICLRSVNELAKYGMVEMDEYGFTLRPMEPGRLMAQHYLAFRTMQAMTEAPVGSHMESLLWVIGRAEELSWIKLRRNEKKALNDINNDSSGKIKFPVLGPNGKAKKRIQEDNEKIIVLANDALSGDPSSLDFTMTQDVNGICLHGSRVARCMARYFTHLRRYKEAFSSYLLANCLKQRLWEDSPFQLKQLSGIGMVTAKALLNAGVSTFEQLEKFDPRRLETITGRKYPFGNQIKDSLEALPPKVELRLAETLDGGRMGYSVTLTRPTPPRQSSQWQVATLIVGSEKDNKLLYHERIRLDVFASPYTAAISASSQGPPSDIVAVLVYEDWVGLDVHDRLTRTPQIASRRNPPRATDRQANMPPYLKATTQGAHTMPGPVTPEPQKEARMELSGLDGNISEQGDQDFEPPSFRLLLDEEHDGEEGHVEGPPEDLLDQESATQGGGCRCRCKDRAICKHVCCKRNLNWSPQDWQSWQAALWSDKGQQKEPPPQGLTQMDVTKRMFPADPRTAPEDSIFSHIRKKSKSLPDVGCHMLSAPVARPTVGGSSSTSNLTADSMGRYSMTLPVSNMTNSSSGAVLESGMPSVNDIARIDRERFPAAQQLSKPYLGRWRPQSGNSCRMNQSATSNPSLSSGLTSGLSLPPNISIAAARRLRASQSPTLMTARSFLGDSPCSPASNPHPQHNSLNTSPADVPQTGAHLHAANPNPQRSSSPLATTKLPQAGAHIPSAISHIQPSSLSPSTTNVRQTRAHIPTATSKLSSLAPSPAHTQQAGAHTPTAISSPQQSLVSPPSIDVQQAGAHIPAAISNPQHRSLSLANPQHGGACPSATSFNPQQSSPSTSPSGTQPAEKRHVAADRRVSFATENDGSAVSEEPDCMTRPGSSTVKGKSVPSLVSTTGSTFQISCSLSPQKAQGVAAPVEPPATTAGGPPRELLRPKFQYKGSKSTGRQQVAKSKLTINTTSATSERSPSNPTENACIDAGQESPTEKSMHSRLCSSSPHPVGEAHQQHQQPSKPLPSVLQGPQPSYVAAQEKHDSSFKSCSDASPGTQTLESCSGPSVQTPTQIGLSGPGIVKESLSCIPVPEEAPAIAGSSEILSWLNREGLGGEQKVPEIDTHIHEDCTYGRKDASYSRLNRTPVPSASEKANPSREKGGFFFDTSLDTPGSLADPFLASLAIHLG